MCMSDVSIRSSGRRQKIFQRMGRAHDCYFLAWEQKLNLCIWYIRFFFSGQNEIISREGLTLLTPVYAHGIVTLPM